MKMEKAVKSAVCGRGKSMVRSLMLAGRCKAKKISGITDAFNSLQRLSLSGVGLETLEGMPVLVSLKTLDISDNDISGGLEIIAKKCWNLEKLYLTGNAKIESLECIEPLKKLRKLKSVEMLACGVVANTKDYREAVFNLLPQIKYLDALTKDGKTWSDEGEDSEDDYSSDAFDFSDSAEDSYDSDHDLGLPPKPPATKKRVRALEGRVGKLERALKTANDRNKKAKNHIVALLESVQSHKTELEEQQHNMKKDVKEMQEEWKKQQEALLSRMQALRQQEAPVPQILAGGQAEAQPAAKKPKLS